MKALVRSTLAVVAVGLATAALAGGPLNTFDAANRIPYHWDMSRWPNGQVPVLTDLGPLGPLTNERANEMVAFAANQWSSVPTSSFRAGIYGDFSAIGLGDVDNSNINSIIGTFNDGGIDVVYDTDGSILQNFFGLPPTGVLGITSLDFVNTGTPEILEAWMVLSGPGIHANDPDGIGFQGVVTHEMGHALNLAHSQSNGAVQNFQVLDAPNPSGCATPWSGTVSPMQIETMYPISTPEPGQSGEGMGTVDRIDDMSALSDIYPAPGYPQNRGTIQGTIYDAGFGEVGSVNVIARNVADPFNDVSSYISGQVSKGDAGPDGSYVFNDLTPGARYVVYVDKLEIGAFSVPVLLTLPGPEEYYNGAMEGADSTTDDRCSWTTVAATPGAPVTADIQFQKYPGAPTFIPMPAVGVPSDITPDGSIAVGGEGDGQQIFRWNLDTGAFDELGGVFTGGVGISDDGTKIVAAATDPIDGYVHAAIFQTDAWTTLPGVAGGVPCGGSSGNILSSAYDISGDGNTVVGLSYGSLGCQGDTIRGFKWTSAGGTVALPKVNSFAYPGRASAVNYDGSVIVGFDQASTGMRRGVVWKNGVASLILTSTNNWTGEALHVTPNGATVLGVSSGATSNQAYRYGVTPKTLTLLGNFGSPYTGAVANSGNDNLSLITGYSTTSGGVTPAMWTAQLHWFNYNTFLSSQGVNTHGVLIAAPTAVSSTGTVMVGNLSTQYGNVGFALKTPTSVVCHVAAGGPPQTQSVSFPAGLDTALAAGDTLGPCACSASAPVGTPTLGFTAHDAFSWTSLPGATGYDVSRGSLSALHASSGDFAVATTDCMESALSATNTTDADAPTTGDGFWYLVRGMTCGGRGTFDTGAPSQAGSRDPGIQLSANTCP